MILSEEMVYNGTKKLLIHNDFQVLGGQPPRGVDHLPVIEIKSIDNTTKGSKNAFKPDLLCYKNEIFYIVECKPTFDENDYYKVHEILNSEARLKLLYVELEQRNILKRINYPYSLEHFKLNIKGCLAYSGIKVEASNVLHIVVENFLGMGKIYY
jgi:hypothetical protein